jgi:hypothetical protein
LRLILFSTRDRPEDIAVKVMMPYNDTGWETLVKQGLEMAEGSARAPEGA